ncbi:MAG: AAA family ATPase [bacterium]|nr:AAA family ATPase [bacterium]
MKKILQYTILEQIDETRGSVIFRVREENSDKTFIIKELKSKRPTLSEIARFRQEYEIIKKVDIEGVIKIYDILEYDNKIALVLEDFDSISLKTLLSNKEIDLKLFLTIGIKLSNTLGCLHKENIVHKDIKPHNILFNAKTEDLKIADFGIANELTHKNDELYNPDVIEGTLAYMSPEQTGRMNRQLDYRTDMYSLGITFYKLLTGSVPFLSTDPMEIIYHHIAIKAKPPADLNPALPKALSDIVMKLLSKMPEERYQNCFGLMSDLEECLNQLEETGTINEFQLGQHDISPMFIVPRILVGRKKEIEMLMNTVQRTASAGERSEIVLVSGQPGIGKSSAIHEAHKSIISNSGYFISGKYDQFRRDVPYSAIIQAFQSLVSQILSENSARIEQWKENLIQALGPNGKVITEVIPEIELIIGKQPEIPELEPEQNQNRFNYTFGKFASVLATKDHPVVLFLDDLQWADLASLNLIDLIITDKDITYFLLIGAYRDNEVNESHSLMMTLDTIKKTGVPVNFIHLETLDAADVNEMICHFLRCDNEDSLPLAELVHRKTNGNPFFVNQFMKTLHDENLLILDTVSGWQWEMDPIERMQITDNVVELMAQKMTKLPETTLELLKICACIGNRFNLEIISEIYEKSIEETLKEITYVLNEGMLRMEGGLYRFQHDRIQVAAYSLVPEDVKEELHYRVGNLVLKKTKEEDLPNEILYIVDHLNAGSKLIRSEDERYTLAQLNLRSGNKAKASAAYQSALLYFKTGIELVTFAETGTGSCWEKQYELCLSLYSDAGEAAYLYCDYDEMERLCEVVLKQAQSLPDTVLVYKIKIRAYMAQNRLVESIDIGINALKFFGIRFPKNPGIIHILPGLIKTNLLLRGKDAGSLLKLPIMKDPSMRGGIRLLAAISSSAYWAQPDLLPLIIFKLMEITIQYGSSAESPYSYCGYGLILCSIGKIEQGYKFGMLGLNLLERMNSKDQVPRTQLVMNGFIRHWKEHLEKSVEPLLTGFQMGLEIGDLEFAAHSALMRCVHLYYIGYEINELKKELVKFGGILKKINQKTQLQQINLYLQLVQNLLGTEKEPYSLRGDIYNEDKMLPVHIEANDEITIATVYINNFMLCYLFNEYGLALKKLKNFEIYLNSERALFAFSLFYFYDSLTRMALYDSLNWFEQKKTLRRVARNRKKLKKMMRHSPSNQSNKYYLVEAERMRVMGRNLKAIKYYNKSIKYARENKFIQEEGIAHERAAQFWLQNNKEVYARTHMQAAHDCYSRWGAAAKVNQLKEKFGHLLTTRTKDAVTIEDSTVDYPATESSTISSTETLDLSTVMKAAQTISSEIVLETLLKKMIKIVLENAGAQKGFLILKNETDHQLYIEAQGTANEEIRVLESISLENNNSLSTAIVNYVNKSKNNILLNNTSTEGKFSSDPYVIKNKPKSILCGPLMHKGKISGIVYLENNLTTNAFTPERLKLMSLLSSQAAISIENARLVSHRENAAKLNKEMEIAANIQTGLLPKNPSLKDYEISAYMKPTDEVGGDYYDVITVEGRDWIVIGDVSGHGVPAGLVMMMVQTCIHNTLNMRPELPPSELLSIVNKTITKNIQLMGESKYMTITVFAAHENGEFTFAGLHEDLLIFRAQSNTVEQVETTGMWVGMFDEIQDRLTDERLTLNTGDILLVYTDGITEAWKKGTIKDQRDPEKDMFGQDRLKNLFQTFGNKSLEQIKEGILTGLEEYLCHDDVTMVLVKRLG